MRRKLRDDAIEALNLARIAIAGALLLFSSPAARCQNSAGDAGFTEVPAYNPYPPGILPPDLDPEIARVQREMRSIFNEALTEWRQLPSPEGDRQSSYPSGQRIQVVEVLGKLLNFDLNMSPFRNEGCGFCHMPYVAFSGPIPSVNLTMVAYPGTYHYRANKRTAQRYTYSPDFPVLEYNTTQNAFFGGNFWDARATGYKLQSADSEQAQGPPVCPGEMGFPDTACIALRLTHAGVPAALREGMGGFVRHQVAGKFREDMRYADWGGGIARQCHPDPLESGRPRQGKQHL